MKSLNQDVLKKSHFVMKSLNQDVLLLLLRIKTY